MKNVQSAPGVCRVSKVAGIFDSDVFAGRFDRRSAFVWMVAQAVRARTVVEIGGTDVVLERGQLSASLRFMAQTWGWDEKSVRRFLSALKKAGEAAAIPASTPAASPAARRMVVTICNFDRFQGRDTEAAAISAATHAAIPATNIKNQEEVEEPVAIATGAGDAPTPSLDPVKSLFDRGLAILGGGSQSNRKLLGKMRRDWGDPAVLAAISECEATRPSDPVAYFTACCAQTAAARGKVTSFHGRPAPGSWVDAINNVQLEEAA